MTVAWAANVQSCSVCGCSAIERASAVDLNGKIIQYLRCSGCKKPIRNAQRAGDEEDIT